MEDLYGGNLRNLSIGPWIASTEKQSFDGLGTEPNPPLPRRAPLSKEDPSVSVFIENPQFLTPLLFPLQRESLVVTLQLKEHLSETKPFSFSGPFSTHPPTPPRPTRIQAPTPITIFRSLPPSLPPYNQTLPQPAYTTIHCTIHSSTHTTIFQISSRPHNVSASKASRSRINPSCSLKSGNNVLGTSSWVLGSGDVSVAMIYMQP